MVHEGRVVSAAGNTMEGSGDPTQHAEVQAIRDTVRRLGRHRMLECTLYVTLEPCPMCAGALLQARVGSLVYAAKNPLLGNTLGGCSRAGLCKSSFCRDLLQPRCCAWMRLWGLLLGPTCRWEEILYRGAGRVE